MTVPTVHPASARPVLEPWQALVWRVEADPAGLRDTARQQMRQVLAHYTGGAVDGVCLDVEPGQPPRTQTHWRGWPLSLSVSRAGRHAVVGLCAGARLGLDLVLVEAVPDGTQVARHFLGPAATLSLAQALPAQRDHVFARAWAEMEARSKCLGLGLEEWSPARQARLHGGGLSCVDLTLDQACASAHTRLVLAVAMQRLGPGEGEPQAPIR